ncbi:MAG TPA: cache domain-containing protein [Stellaceae bacterium]|nr:cache domain-containing protein [Stellaceae bacterium]
MRDRTLTNRADIVDIDVDPLAERSRRRQTLWRIGLPVGGVGLIIGFLLGITIYADSANRAGVLGLSDTLLRSTQERIALQVEAYLEPASHATLLATSMLGRDSATTHADEARIFAASVLQETPQVANVLFADNAGNFMLVTRTPNGPAGDVDTKRILVTPAGRSVEWTTRDRTGKTIASHQDPKDTYDARTRSWFTGARAKNDVFWSGAYIFFTTQAPGVTAAVHGPGPNPDVIGVDIQLDALSRFLGKLPIGRTGRAYIATKDGTMIAGPDPKRILAKKNGELVPARIDAIGDPQLAASWDHFRAEGPGDRVIEVDGQRLISIVTPLANNDQDWLLFITVPESEFSGFVTANSHRAALLLLIVVALAVGLAVLLVRQGLRADRSARIVAERSQAVQQQSAAFARLAAEAGKLGEGGQPPPALTETLAEATGAKRASLWRLSDGGQALRCEDSFEPATGGHIGGLELSRQEVPALIEALIAGETIDAQDARVDRRVAALHSSLMAPIGSISLLAMPIAKAGRTIGTVALEDARRDPAAIDFARASAALLGLGLPALSASEAGLSEPVPPRPGTPVAPPEIEPVDAQGIDPALALIDAAQPTQHCAAVLALSLPDTTQPLAHQIACAMQRAADQHGIPYVKMMGTTIIAAAGYGSRTAAALTDAAARLADVAIALREHCADLFEDTEGAMGFSLGLDAGTVTGAMLGTSPGLFNLWGEAVQGAGALAASAPVDTIQTSEQAYLLLRQAFLFRPRGLFHRPHVGEARSYVLAGRS